MAISVKEALADYTRLSSGQLRGQCPFTERHDRRNDGSKSFFMSPDLNAYHCFSCGAKGRLTTVLTKKMGVSVWDALDFVTLDAYEDKPKKSLPKEALTVDFSRQPELFISRGFSPRFLRNLRVGSFIDENGVEVATIPLYRAGKLIGVIYRKDIGRKKYIHSSEGFDKDNFLYNQNDYDEALVVEGFTDCWRMFHYSFWWATCLQGTHASEYVVSELSKKAKVYVALDNDFAGVTGSETLYHKLKTKTEVLFVPYPEKDPERCDKETWLAAYNQATPYYEFSLAMGEAWGDRYYDMKKAVLKDLRK